MLNHGDRGVRYWGALGLLTQGEPGVSHGYKALRKALKDSSPIVQITAAEAIGRYGKPTDVREALDVLIEHASPEGNVFLGIAAWNALDHMDEKALPAVERIRAIGTEVKRAPPRTSKYASRLKPKTLADLDKR